MRAGRTAFLMSLRVVYCATGTSTVVEAAAAQQEAVHVGSDRVGADDVAGIVDRLGRVLEAPATPMVGVDAATVREAVPTGVVVADDPSAIVERRGAEEMRPPIAPSPPPLSAAGRASGWLPEAARAEPTDGGALVAMLRTGAGARTGRGAAQQQGSGDAEGGDQGRLAGLLGRVARLLLGRLEFGVGIVDALLGFGLRQAGLLLHDRHQGGAVALVELAALERGREDARDRRGHVGARWRGRRCGARRGH